MMRLRYNRKAVSPVIASVLMIVIVMAGMTLLFGFVASYTQSFQAGTGSSVLESLTFEDAWFTTSPRGPQLSIWVYNTGKADVTLNKVNSVYVNGVSALVLDGDTTIKVGAHFQLILPLQPWASGETFAIKLATHRGSTFEEVFAAP
jgi:flagellin-like protein